MSEAELTKLEIRIEKMLTEIKNDFKELYLTKADAESKFVKWGTFTWVVGILMVIILGVLGVIYARLDAVDTKVSQTREDVAEFGPIKDFINNLEITTQ